MWPKLKLIIPATILVVLILFTFNGLSSSFYEQDEWLGIGNYLTQDTNKFCIHTERPFEMLVGGSRQLSAFITCLSYNYFPFNTTPLVIYRLLLHFINSLLVFILIKKILRGTLPALLGAAFFAVNSVSQGTVTWFAAHGTIPATTFVLIALFALLKAANYEEKDEKKVNRKWVALSLLALYVSFLFKQIAIFMFVLFPLAAILYKTPRSLSKKYFIFIFTFLAFIIFWIDKFKSVSGINALFLTGSSTDFYQTLVSRSILYPLTSFSLIYVPPEIFLNYARYITNIYYPFFPPEQFILIAQSVVLDMLAILFSFSLFALLYFLSSKVKDKKVLWFFVLFSLFSFLPYVVISKNFAYLESRYYYLAAVPSAFILSWIINTVWFKSKKIGWVLILFTVLIIAFHAITVNRDVEKQVHLSQERKSFLSQLTAIKQHLNSKRNVFFITGNGDFYISGHKIPFQNGAGHILAVWYYYHTKEVPEELIKNAKLFELGSQGYFEYDGRGFGYFSDKESLMAAMDKNVFSDIQLTALYYNANDKNLTDISDKIIEELKKSVK